MIRLSFVGYSGMISAFWKADSGDCWTIPLGFVFGKMFPMGGEYEIETEIGPYWSVIKPDGGVDWSIKFLLNLWFPK